MQIETFPLAEFDSRFIFWQYFTYYPLPSPFLPSVVYLHGHHTISSYLVHASFRQPCSFPWFPQRVGEFSLCLYELHFEVCILYAFPFFFFFPNWGLRGGSWGRSLSSGSLPVVTHIPFSPCNFVKHFVLRSLCSNVGFIVWANV